VAELVYMPIETALLRDARARGCRTLNGAPMVALQAAGSLELFTGVRPDRDRMLRHVNALVDRRRRRAA
jgi:shikimate dehydrogenase